MISTGGQLTILESVDSTNNYAMAKVRTGLAKHGDGFFAMAQVQGKGQRGKTWLTEPGTNIILTLVLKAPPLQLTRQFQFTMAIALAVYDFFSFYAGEETAIKWPNDIYWRDRKAGGILIENIIGGKELGIGNWELGEKQDAGSGQLRSDISGLTTPWQWAITGMGININQTSFPGNIRNAVSLKQITGKDWQVVELAKDLCTHVQNRYTQLLAGNNILEEYNLHLFKKGQTVKFKKESRVFEGLVKEVNESGELVVMTAVEEHFSFGEIEWVF